MKKNLSLLIIVVTLFSACKKEKETPNGMKYTVLEEGDGTLPKSNQFLVFDFLMKDNKDSVWASTYEVGIPGAAFIGDSSKISREDGMTQMFRQLSVGDSVTTSMPLKKFFSELVRAPMPPTMDSTTVITYLIKVRDISSPDDFYKNREAWVFNHDEKAIEKYLKDNNLTAQRDSTGVQYILHTNTGGPKPTLQNCVQVRYRGRLMRNGQIFDEGETSFPLDGLITGWKVAVPLMGVGDSATFFIPSKHGYGPDGIPRQMPPDAVLIFDVRLLNINGVYDPQTRQCK